MDSRAKPARREIVALALLLHVGLMRPASSANRGLASFVLRPELLKTTTGIRSRCSRPSSFNPTASGKPDRGKASANRRRHRSFPWPATLDLGSSASAKLVADLLHDSSDSTLVEHARVRVCAGGSASREGSAAATVSLGTSLKPTLLLEHNVRVSLSNRLTCVARHRITSIYQDALPPRLRATPPGAVGLSKTSIANGSHQLRKSREHSAVPGVARSALQTPAEPVVTIWSGSVPKAVC